MLIVVAHRTSDEEDDPLAALTELSHVSEIALAELDRAACTEIVAAKLAQLGDLRGEVPEALLDVVLDRAEGNPFYLEELLTFVHTRGIDPADGAALRALDLPDSLHSLVLSRIDTVAEGPRRSAKVASVIGRHFRTPMLRGVYPDLGTVDRAGPAPGRAAPDRSDRAGAAGRGPGRRGAPVQARDHRAGGVRGHPDGPAGVACTSGSGRTWRRSARSRRRWTCWPTTTAGGPIWPRSASSCSGPGTGPGPTTPTRPRSTTTRGPLLWSATRARPAVLLHLGAVLELTGRWIEAQATYGGALDLATRTGQDRAGHRVRKALAEVARKQGRYEEAAELLAVAQSGFAGLGDQAGVGEVLHLAGTLAAQQGDYELARERYEASLAIRRTLDDRDGMAALFSNLAIVAEYTGDLDRAKALNEQALALRLEVGNRWAIGVSQNNLGMIAQLQGDHAEAVARFTEAMRLNTEVGDEWMVAIAHNNLANATRDQGDLEVAAHHFGRSLAGYRRFADRWALSIIYEDIAVLALRRDSPEQAVMLIGAADTLRAELGSPRAPAQQDDPRRGARAGPRRTGPAGGRAARAGSGPRRSPERSAWPPTPARPRVRRNSDRSRAGSSCSTGQRGATMPHAHSEDPAAARPGSAAGYGRSTAGGGRRARSTGLRAGVLHRADRGRTPLCRPGHRQVPRPARW